MALEPVVEKPALPLLALLLSYITELAFAFLVFILFLLATWGLHSCGEALGLVKSLFFWRLLELLVVSFGTLLCVLFILKVSIEFVKKLILQEPIVQTGSELRRLHPAVIVRRFGEPGLTQPLSLIICLFIVWILLCFGISFAEIIRDGSDDVSILACEMLCETGPDFLEPIDKHVIMLKDYTKYIEKKRLSFLLKAFPNYSPKEVFADVNEILVNAKGTQEEVAHDIWRSGEEIMLFRLKAPKLLPRGITFYEYRKAPEWLLNDIAEALKESQKALTLFDEKPTMENAVNLCIANKKAMLLLFLARSSYNISQNIFGDFQRIVKATKEKQDNVAHRLPDDDPRKEFLLIISDSEQRRFDILDEIKKRNMQAAIERMWDAIEIAYSRRSKLLELCAKNRSTDNYSEEIGS